MAGDCRATYSDEVQMSPYDTIKMISMYYEIEDRVHGTDMPRHINSFGNLEVGRLQL